MTQSGEQLTQSGEFEPQNHNIYSYNKAVSLSYTVDLAKPRQVEIYMTGPDPKQLPLYQMIFVLKGKLSLCKKGKTQHYGQIESQQHNLCRIIPASSRLLLDNPNDEIICINLSPSFLQRYLPAGHPVQLQLSSGDPADPILLSPINLFLTPEISSILQRLGNNTNSGFCDQLLMESKVIELLALQISQFEQLQHSEAPSQLRKEEMERMQEARTILLQHTGEQLSLRALAHLVGTNEFNLKRDFKAAFGTTVYGYLNQYKMEQAKTMLIEKDVTIAEISNKMGYKHATHFSSAFKKYFGYLPNKIKSSKLSLLLFIEEFSALYENLAQV